ncbi:MAG TPA: MFS transporter, partial [Thermomicrobiales bacterium]|nr:MFS transporter [Thermomicrobiales bacterium]
MGAYWIALRRAPRALRLFLVFTFLANAGLGVYQLLYPLYLVRLGYRDDVVGAVSAATMVAVAAGALALGPLLRRHGAWRCLCVGAALLAVAAAGQALARPLPLLLAAAALAGLGQAGILVPTMPFLLPHTSEEGRTETVAATYALLSAALMLGALVGGHLPALLGADVAPGAAAPYRATLLVGVALIA